MTLNRLLILSPVEMVCLIRTVIILLVSPGKYTDNRPFRTFSSVNNGKNVGGSRG